MSRWPLVTGSNEPGHRARRTVETGGEVLIALPTFITGSLSGTLVVLVP
jgi:hypothetical protein